MLVSADGRLVASTKLTGFTSPWQKHTATLRGLATEPKARLNLILEGQGTLDLDMVSLFPEKTWRNRPGGLRADMVQERPIALDDRVVAQVSRWDRLKDPIGVLTGFARHVAPETDCPGSN